MLNLTLGHFIKSLFGQALAATYNCMLKHKTSKWCKFVHLKLSYVVLRCLQIKVSCGVVLDFIHNSSLSLCPPQSLWGQGHSWAIMGLFSVLVKLVIMEAISTAQLTALCGSLEVRLLTVSLHPDCWGSYRII